MYTIGYDIGSSSIKASIVNIDSGEVFMTSKYPDSEMAINSKKAGWAEQDPEIWWDAVCILTKSLLLKGNINPSLILAIGISYQMHGLVLVDKDQKVLRPAIIWCDSRASDIGEKAFNDLGNTYCLENLLNSPGNFTMSKLRWVKENEPYIFDKIHKWMLPGDYIAMKFTGNINSTVSGYSEGICWEFKNHMMADNLLAYYEIPKEIMPEITDTFSNQGRVNIMAANDCGLSPGTQVTYRAGDQPNNAMSLNVLHPGEVAATGGTSGVVYGISETLHYDHLSRVNGFAHVNHTKAKPRIGQLLCINGCGILYAWMRNNVCETRMTYSMMEDKIQSVPIGSEGLRILPFGNGSERMFNDKMTGARMVNLHFNLHTRAHMLRAALQGIAFSFVYGMNILRSIDIQPSVIKVGNDNLFLSQTFTKTLANLLRCNIEVYETTGATGAAKASMVALGIYEKIDDAIKRCKPIQTIEYSTSDHQYVESYGLWLKELNNLLT